ncbi:MAG: protein kinase [Polyangiaceae bacterium]
MGRSSHEAQRQLLTPYEVIAGRYHVQELLGRGGMGEVYRVEDRVLGEDVALKMCAPDDVSAAARLLDEARLARRVSHPNVARVHDVGRHQELVYLTVELIDGGTLGSLLQAEKHLDARRAVGIGKSICAGLGAAHAVGILHGDLKPANVLIDRKGRVAITDFGIARSLVDASAQQGPVFGTQDYVAPEVLHRGPVDRRADLFALGVVLFEMLTGEAPELASDGPARRVISAGAPAALAEIVERCLAFMPDERPASAEVIAGLLAEAVGAGAGTEERDTEDVSRGVTARMPEIPSTRRSPSLNVPTARAVPSARRVIAVLPFRYSGPPAQSYLGVGVADEIADVLSRTRELRPLGPAATARYAEERDVLSAGAGLGAAVVIDGSLQIVAERVRLTVRLLDGATGEGVLEDRRDGTLTELFELQASLAQRIAEHFRVDIPVTESSGRLPAGAMEAYFEARGHLRTFGYQSASRAVAAFERCLELSPGLAPAIAGLAVAHQRAWFQSVSGPGEPDWERLGEESCGRALELAANLSDSHLAAGIGAVQRRDYVAAARALRRALELSPHSPDANEYLGVLQCEAGRASEGIRRLRLADSLDPTLALTLLFIARDHALHGRFDACDAALDELDRRRGEVVGPSRLFRARAMAWRGDAEGLRRLAGDAKIPTPATFVGVPLYAATALGDIDAETAKRHFSVVLSSTDNLRRLTLSMQLMTEAHAAAGHTEAAMFHLLRAATGALVDVEWMERCPVLADLRRIPIFEQARHKVRERAQAIWEAG